MSLITMPLITMPGNSISVIGGHGLSVPLPLTQTIDLLHCEVTGTGHHCDEDTGEQLAKTGTLALDREPKNPHDPDAIAIHLAGRKVGYIPRCHNTVLVLLLDAGKCLRARVEGVFSPEVGDWLDPQVVVEMGG